MGKFNWKAQKERLKKNAETAGQQGSSTLRLPEGAKFFKVKKGTMMLDIIPYVVTDPKHLSDVPVGQPWPKKPIKVHFGVGPSEKRVICPTTIGKPCPICEEYAALRKKFGSDAKEKHDHLRPRLRELYNVIDTENEDDGIQIMEISYHTFGKKLDQEIKEADDDDFANYFFPDEGSTLKVRFSEETAGKTKFLTAARIDFKERDRGYKESIVEEAFCFDDMLIIPSYEEIERMFLDLPVDEADKAEDAEEEDEKPRRPQREQKVEKPAPEDEDEPKAAPARSRETSGRSRGDSDASEPEAPPRSRRREPEPEDEPEKQAPRRRQREPEPEPEAETPRSRRQRDPEPEPEPEPERPRSRRREPEPEPEDEQGGSGGACPDSKGVFGETCDALEACFDCNLWGDCHDAQKKNKKSKKG